MSLWFDISYIKAKTDDCPDGNCFDNILDQNFEKGKNQVGNSIKRTYKKMQKKIFIESKP
jgi:hypothetical protein